MYEQLIDLCHGRAALFRPPELSFPAADMPSFISASLSNLRAANAQIGGVSRPGLIRAHGDGLSRSDAIIPGIAEALERYCASIYSERLFITASGNELGGSALDLDIIPVVSDSEAQNPKCPIKRVSRKDPIRWVKGVSLTERRPIYLPAAMIYSRLSPLLPTERFWLSISTGCAAHTLIESAIRAAVFEVIERDAVSITWLQQLSLPEVDIDCIPEPLAPYWDCYKRASIDMECRFFDATTDMGVPTVYGIRIASQSEVAHTVVGCSTGPTFSGAIIKVLRDLVSIGGSFDHPRQVPADREDFTHMLDGATYMAHRDRFRAFDFLLNGRSRIQLSQREKELNLEKWSLEDILDRFRKLHIPVYAVDLTTDEAKQVGVQVIRVLIPMLQPLSFAYTAQYKGHRRLYDAPSAMGYSARSENALNDWPQPFA